MSAYAMAITMLAFSGLSALTIIRSVNWLERDYWRHHEHGEATPKAARPASDLAA